MQEIGATLHELMARLGYSRYGAQGGDWGAFVTGWLAAQHAEHVLGIHLNLLPLRRDAAGFVDTSEEERRYLAELDTWLKEETGYQWIQGTRPQTLAFALADSPVGLAAWIVEKFRAWTDCGGKVTVPTGYCEFPREILRPPRAAAERVFPIRRWSVMPRGGHFAAFEQPAALAHEIREFFRPLA